MWKPHLNLKVKALAMVLGVVVCTAGLVSWVDLARSTASIRRSVENTAQGLAASIGTACELPMAVGDEVELKRLADRYLELDPDVAFIALIDGEGRTVASSVRDRDAWSDFGESLSNGADGGVGALEGSPSNGFITRRAVVGAINDFGITNDLESDPEPVHEAGTVAVGVSLDSFHRTHAEQRTMAILTTVLALCVSGLIIIPVVGRWTRRLESLVHASDWISSGDFTHKLSDERQDEVGTLVRSFEQMRSAIEERDRREQRRREELETARAAAEDANAAKSQFLAHMSHEIRTPLNGVVGMLDLLHDTEMTDRQARFVDIGRSSADALLGVINDILDFSKIEAGQFHLETIDFNPQEVIESVVEMLAPKGQQKGLEVVCSITPTVPRCAKGDPSRFRQIVLNLMGNALKFTEEGEIVVRAEARELDGGRVELRVAVADTGIGIPPEKRDRLFKSFSQVDGSTTRKFGGTGLGLAICKNLAEMMGGSIGLTKDREVGAEFWFTAVLDHSDTCKPKTPVGELKPARVLVVDDNVTNTEILLEALGNWGMESESASDGVEALQVLRETEARDEPFDIILLDMQMPNMDGVQFADALQSDPELGSYLVVMLSSISDRADIQDLRNHGIDAYLSKPVRLSLLYDTLARLGSDQTRTIVETVDDRETVDVSSLAGARVLVAEDNAVNQIVISELLRSRGMHVTVAGNGQEAVNEWRQSEVDLILMDCEMPVMDGLAATAAIRAAEAEFNRSHTPIIALTAKAIQGDREMCLARGMDDYLSKPLDPVKVLNTMKLHLVECDDAALADAEHLSGGTEGFEGEETGNGAEIDEVLEIDAALARCGGNAAILGRVLRVYVESLDDIMESLDSALAGGDETALQKTAHTLKGASANIGAQGAASLAANIERRAGAPGDAPCADEITDLKRELDRVTRAIQTFEDSGNIGGGA